MTTSTAAPDQAPPDLSTDDHLVDVAVDLLDAVLASADVEVIGVSNWWDRATSALKTGAATGTDVRSVVTRMAGKLQVETLSEPSARAVRATAALLADPVVFRRWAQLADRDAVYIAAMVRLRRADRRAAKQAAKAKPATDQTPATEEPMF